MALGVGLSNSFTDEETVLASLNNSSASTGALCFKKKNFKHKFI